MTDARITRIGAPTALVEVEGRAHVRQGRDPAGRVLADGRAVRSS